MTMRYLPALLLLALSGCGGGPPAPPVPAVDLSLAVLQQRIPGLESVNLAGVDPQVAAVFVDRLEIAGKAFGVKTPHLQPMDWPGWARYVPSNAVVRAGMVYSYTGGLALSPTYAGSRAAFVDAVRRQQPPTWSATAGDPLLSVAIHEAEGHGPLLRPGAPREAMVEAWLRIETRAKDRERVLADVGAYALTEQADPRTGHPPIHPELWPEYVSAYHCGPRRLSSEATEWVEGMLDLLTPPRVVRLFGP